jgi:phenylpyruvate tautomerase PptA (4-oxalocrotonate tautomerase family)
MPLIQISAAKDSLNKSDQNRLVTELSNAVLRAEGASIADPAAQALVWTYYHEHEKAAIYIGGENIDEPPLRIAINTPEGALSESARKTLVKEIGSLVDELLGSFEGRLNHWAMLYEVNEGSWAGAGQVFPLAGIQAAMNIKVA